MPEATIEALLAEGRTFPPPSEFKRSEEHTSELQSRSDLVCRLLLEKKKKNLCERLPFDRHYRLALRPHPFLKSTFKQRPESKRHPRPAQSLATPSELKLTLPAIPG